MTHLVCTWIRAGAASALLTRSCQWSCLSHPPTHAHGHIHTHTRTQAHTHTLIALWFQLSLSLSVQPEVVSGSFTIMMSDVSPRRATWVRRVLPVSQDLSVQRGPLDQPASQAPPDLQDPLHRASNLTWRYVSQLSLPLQIFDIAYV